MKTLLFILISVSSYGQSNPNQWLLNRVDTVAGIITYTDKKKLTTVTLPVTAIFNVFKRGIDGVWYDFDDRKGESVQCYGIQSERQLVKMLSANDIRDQLILPKYYKFIQL